MSLLNKIFEETDYHDLSMESLMGRSLIEIVGIRSRLQGIRSDDSVVNHARDAALSSLLKMESYIRWAEINYRHEAGR
jgi:hypothetical protein